MTHFDQNHVDPLKTLTGIYITVHGHFYQPPRENPYLNVIERQSSANPFHDWNERICHECYRPNAFARIVNAYQQITAIVNNFEYLSFNIGPTLMSWLENHDEEVYQRIIEGDKNSAQRLNGHGNAIAQVYNHIIMPLANERDKYTQIRWGKEDFYQRFGRYPEGMWLAETAVDYPTLDALINEGIKFVVLSPFQALRCRHQPSWDNHDPEWYDVDGGYIDSTRPYRCYVNEERTKFIDLFFYEGNISGEMGFNNILINAESFANRIAEVIKPELRPQLINVATDGETFGHHKRGTEKCIAYSVSREFEQRGWTVTNYAHYLSLEAPSWEVELKPVSSWSCSHGVERWQADCGCGGSEHDQQKWRKPLRNGLNWLRDQLTEIYEEVGIKFFIDPWLARDEYIEVILERSPTKIEQFLSRHQTRQLAPSEQIDALRLLEMQRHSLLMFTSCGWFFEEISRPEGTQILRYAAKAMELAGEVSGIQLEENFIKYLEKAPSNVLEIYQNGDDVYDQLVITSQINLKKVAAHYAISSLFSNEIGGEKLYCYDTQQLDYEKQQLGSLTLAIGQVRLTSEITWESAHFIFAVLHLGGWDFHCCIESFNSRSDYSKIKNTLFKALNQGNLVDIILVMSEMFREESFGLEDLFAEEREKVMQKLTEKTRLSLDQLYTQIYRDNYSILVAFQRDNLPVPQELQVAAEVALAQSCLKIINNLETLAIDSEEMENCLIDLKAKVQEANNLKCQLNIPEGKKILEQIMVKLVTKIVSKEEIKNEEKQIETLELITEIGTKLNLNLSIDKLQEICFNYLNNERNRTDFVQKKTLIKLGQILAISVNN